jgi:hypothetical protein
MQQRLVAEATTVPLEGVKPGAANPAFGKGMAEGKEVISPRFTQTFDVNAIAIEEP